GLYDLDKGRRLLWLALQLLGPASRPAGHAAAPRPGREGDGTGLRAELSRRPSGARLLYGGQPPPAIPRRRLLWLARTLEPLQVQRLQGRLCAVQQRAS